MRNILVWIFGISFLTFPFAGHSQESTSKQQLIKRKILFRGYYENGKVFKTNDFLKYNKVTGQDIDRFQGISLQALWQTNGKHQWEDDFGHPRLGLGIWTAQFFDAPNLGTPFAFYGLFNAPFAQGKRWKWNYELEMGLAMNWQPFNPYNNKTNIAIGDDETVYLDLGTYFEYQISPKFSLEVGASLGHFSNGALKLPNKGINVITPKFVLQYRPLETHFVKPAESVAAVPKKYEWNISYYGGSNNVLYTGTDIDSLSKYKGVYFPQTGLITTMNRLVGKKSKIGIGLSLGYNGSANAKILIDGTELDEGNASFKEGFEVSIFPSYELVVDRASVIIQPGFYLYRQKYDGRRPKTYQRLGFKYHLSDNFYAGLNLRAYKYHVSEYIEWNIGYRFDW